jgi:lysyl-tRNA synthetase class 2
LPLDATRLRARARILRAVRGWFDDHGYLEVHTPVLVPAGAMEPHLEPVEVAKLQLHTSPEFAMKRVLAAGLGRIYQMTPCFREEEVGPHHSREFTMLEWYRAGAGTPELMDEVEALIGAAAAAIDKPAPTFERRPVESFLPHDLLPDEWFFQWVDAIEPTLTSPTIVYDYPHWQAALAQRRGRHADRFEVYLGGVELANAFAEELSSDELRRRIARNNAVRQDSGRPPHPIDERFLFAVDRMPRAAGIALGIDRLVMVLTGATELSQVQVR